MSKNVKMLTRVIVPCRFSYLNCWEPTSINGGEPKYSLSAIVSKDDKVTIRKIENAIENAKKEAISKWGGRIPSNLKTVLRDGDLERDDEAYANSLFFNANSKTAPQVVNKNVEPILDKSEVYSGCYGNISVTFYGYSVNGSKGIAASLGNIQLVRQGEPLGGKSNAAQDFSIIEDDDFLS